MMKNNPFMEELQKIAAYRSSTDNVDEDDDPMNPDRGPAKNPQDAEESRNKSDAQVEEEIRKAKQDAQDSQLDGYKTAEELWQKIASYMPEFGALAKLIEMAQGGEDIPAEFAKEAAEALEAALTSEDMYVDVLTKVSHELYAEEGAVEDLFSPDGMEYIQEKLSSLLEDDTIEKIANDNMGQGANPNIPPALNTKPAEEKMPFWEKARSGVSNFLDSMKNVRKIKAELEAAQNEMNQLGLERETLLMDPENVSSPRNAELAERQIGLNRSMEGMEGKFRQGTLGWGAVGAGLAGGAIYGGKKLYDSLHDDASERVAENDDKVLLSKVASDKLNTEFENRKNGGTIMNSRTRVAGFLKIAGAAGLVGMANNDQVDVQLRKLAADQFDHIASLGRKDMDVALVKVAQQIYTEDQLHEIVAGRHTGALLDKVAFYLDANEMSLDELHKTAGASGVAAKGIAGALTDAKAEIQPTIEEEKKNTEGAGREYIGVVAGSGKNAKGGTASVGGDLIDSRAGYSVINNPEKYSVGKTASLQEQVEEAVLAKQAAAETWSEAEAFLKKVAHLIQN